MSHLGVPLTPKESREAWPYDLALFIIMFGSFATIPLWAPLVDKRPIEQNHHSARSAVLSEEECRYWCIHGRHY